MDYSKETQNRFESVVENGSSGKLSIETFVLPDAIVVMDSKKDSVRISKGKKKQSAFVEYDGKTLTLFISSDTREDAIENALHIFAVNYEEREDMKKTFEYLNQGKWTDEPPYQL